MFTLLFLWLGSQFNAIEGTIVNDETYNLVFHLYDMFIKVFQSENIHLGVPVSAIFISFLLYVLNIIIFSKETSQY